MREDINIQDVRELCQRGALRAYAKDGGVFLEDTASGESVRLDGHRAKASATPPRREPERRSRVERMFGRREDWNTSQADDDQGPYKGFLIVKCEECGEVKAFCAKRETYSFKCSCGYETPLEKLRPVFMHCKCGKTFRYKTNITTETFSHNCLSCKAPVDLELGKRQTAYVTVGERR